MVPCPLEPNKANSIKYEVRYESKDMRGREWLRVHVEATTYRQALEIANRSIEVYELNQVEPIAPVEVRRRFQIEDGSWH